MARYLTFIFCVCHSMGLYCQTTKDSTMSFDMHIKGVDFRCGFGSYNLSRNNELSLLNKLTLNQQFNPDFSKAKIYNGTGRYEPYIGIVLVPDHHVKRKLFMKEEMRIGLSFTFSGYNDIYLIWDTIQTGQHKEVQQYLYSYVYRCQQLQLSYLVNGRIGKGNWAYYSGLGASFGFVTWKTQYTSNSWNGIAQFSNHVMNMEDSTLAFNVYPDQDPLLNFSTGTASLYIPIGIKYNLSCDINLFAETQFNLQYYHNGLHAKEKWIPYFMMNFGFRYKFMNDVIKDTDKQKVFW